MTAAIQPLRFDPLGLFVPGSGVSPQLLELVHPQLEAARRSLLGCGQSAEGDGAPVTAESWSDIDVVEQPDRIIADYRKHRQRSELGRVLATARRLAEAVDRVVVVAGQATLLSIRALVDACCHPYYNELSRAERGGQPRIYFAGDSLDNDVLAGLLDLLGQDGHLSGTQGSWGLMFIDDISVDGAHESRAVGAARGALLTALEKATGGNRQELARRCVCVCRPNTLLDYFAQESGCDRFDLAVGAGSRRSMLDAAGLLPAATLGIDVRRLLEGAARLNVHFRDVPPPENVVLSYVGACHLMLDQSRPWLPTLVPWADGLRSLALWQGHLTASSLDPSGVLAASAARMPRAGRTFPINLLVDAVRRDRIFVGDVPDHGSSELLPDLLAAAVRQAGQRAADARQPWAALHLPRLDEPTIGQLFQLFLLTSLLARRLPAVARSSNSLASRS